MRGAVLRSFGLDVRSTSRRKRRGEEEGDIKKKTREGSVLNVMSIACSLVFVGCRGCFSTMDRAESHYHF